MAVNIIEKWTIIAIAEISAMLIYPNNKFLSSKNDCMISDLVGLFS